MDRAPYAVCSSLSADAATAVASGTRSILVLCGVGCVHQGHEPDRAAFRANADVPLAGTLSGQRRAGIITPLYHFNPLGVVIESCRNAALGQPIDWQNWGIGLIVAIAVALLGQAFF